MSDGLIVGSWKTRVVWVDGKELSPAASLKVWNHSPDGFNWSYGGSGPAQLALALLLRFDVPKHRAIELHQLLKEELIAKLPPHDFAISMSKVTGWIKDHQDRPTA